MSRFIQTLVQLKGESEPQPHYALVFDDATSLAVFMIYRNALTSAAKALASQGEDLWNDEIFQLIQLSEFISSALDMELYWKKGGQDG
jgi:hypothetical protein